MSCTSMNVVCVSLCGCSRSNFSLVGCFPQTRLKQLGRMCFKTLFIFKLVGWDFGYCGHYWPVVPAPGDSDSDGDCGEVE
jgi:hypothetical protein